MALKEGYFVKALNGSHQITYEVLALHILLISFPDTNFTNLIPYTEQCLIKEIKDMYTFSVSPGPCQPILYPKKLSAPKFTTTASR